MDIRVVFRILAAIILAVSFSVSAGAGTVYVNRLNAAGPWTGASWATAYMTIQEGVDAANPGDDVWVAQGTYGSTSVAVLVMAESVNVYGGFRGTEATLSQRNWRTAMTYIDGDSERRCVIGASYARLDGFTLTEGSCGFADSGCAMYNVDCENLIVANCEFTLNIVGGGFTGGTLHNLRSPILVQNCLFRFNSVSGDGLVYSEQSPTVITNSLFLMNMGTSGCIYGFFTDLTITNCTFLQNGAGVYSESGACTVTNCVLWDNPDFEVDGDPLPVVTYSVVQGGYSGMGNLDTDPMIEASSAALLPNSPCIDAGRDTSGVAFGSVTTDINGQPRGIDGRGEGPTGPPVPGDGSDYDIGASEAPVDTTPPTVVSVTPTTANPTNADTVEFAVVFSEDIWHFDLANDVIVGESGVAHTGISISGTGRNYSVGIQGTSGDGSLGLSVSTSSDVSDPAGNLLSSSVSSELVLVDNTAPDAELTSAAPSAVSGPVSVTLALSDPSGTLGEGSIVTENANVSAFAGSGTSFSFTLTPNADGEFSAILAAGAFSDEAGNSNTASNTLTRVYDSTGPGFFGLTVVPAEACINEKVRISLLASELLEDDPLVTVNDNDAVLVSKSKAGLSYTYEYTVQDSDPLGAAEIVVSGADLVGNLGGTTSDALLMVVAPPPMPLSFLGIAACLLALGTLIVLFGNRVESR